MEIDIECISEGMSSAEAEASLKQKLAARGMADEDIYEQARLFLTELTAEGMTVNRALKTVLDTADKSLKAARELEGDLEQAKQRLEKESRQDAADQDIEFSPETLQQANQVLGFLVENGVSVPTAYQTVYRVVSSQGDLDELACEEYVQRLKKKDAADRLRRLAEQNRGERSDPHVELAVSTVERLVEQGVSPEIAVKDVNSTLNTKGLSSEQIEERLAATKAEGLKKRPSQQELIRQKIQDRILNHPGKGKAKGHGKGRPF